MSLIKKNMYLVGCAAKSACFALSFGLSPILLLNEYYYLSLIVFFLINTSAVLDRLYVNGMTALNAIFNYIFFTEKINKHDKFKHKKADKKEFSIKKAVFVFLASICFFYITAIFFGAPLFEDYFATFFFSLVMTLFTAYPLIWYFYFCDSTVAIVKSLCEVRLFALLHNNIVSFILSAMFGAWLGAFSIPLDWDRPWQKWPIPCCCGASFGVSFYYLVHACRDQMLFVHQVFPNR